MAAKDIFHDAVKRALENEGWLITNDPLFLRFGGLDMYIGLGAEKVLAAERNQEKIAVEVKSFVAPSTTTEFSTALGQYLKYQLALEEEQPERLLSLAVPLDTYRSFFTLELPRLLIQRYQVGLIVFDPQEETNAYGTLRERKMAKVEQYRQLIQELLLGYSEIKASNEEVEAEVIFDRERVGLCPAVGIATKLFMRGGQISVAYMVVFCI
ncbi:hypothetical protein Npun_R0526 [Nostoc punctiforme PCC 73102]|uniref:FdxN element excision controlling factor protein n=2 Tax=Nostoc punctiforme TaxID=272131 RepID=B2J848_NOSP7|nr:hypothetical protein Npun_R0526 [Nostoc punctiforme PCC 73102]